MSFSSWQQLWMFFFVGDGIWWGDCLGFLTWSVAAINIIAATKEMKMIKKPRKQLVNSLWIPTRMLPVFFFIIMYKNGLIVRYNFTRFLTLSYWRNLLNYTGNTCPLNGNALVFFHFICIYMCSKRLLKAVCFDFQMIMIQIKNINKNISLFNQKQIR